MPALARAGAFADSLQHIKDALLKAQQETVDLKHDEEVQHTKFMQFCSGTIETKTNDIDELNAQITEHQAVGEKAAADALSFEESADQEASKAATGKSELKEITATREEEAKAYADVKADLEVAITQTEQAHEVLRNAHDAKHYTEPAEAALVQISKISNKLRYLSLMNTQTLSKLTTYLNKAKQAPTGDQVAYESGMGGGFGPVLQLLEELKGKFQEELQTATTTEHAAKEEFNKVSATYNKLIQQAEHNVETFKNKATEKRAISGDEAKQKKEKENLVVQFTDVLETTKKQKAEQERFFEERQMAMAKDLNAFTQALDVIADLQSGAFLQTSLLQVKSRISNNNDVAERIAKAKAYLQKAGGKLGSKMLLQVAAKEDVFAKVKQLISDLITRLTNEAAEEADDKAYCDAELAREGKAKTEKEEKLEKVKTDLAKCENDIKAAAASIETLNTSIKNSSDELTKATEERAETKTSLANQIKELTEMKEGMETAKDALAVALEGAGFIQTAKFRRIHKQPLTTGAYESKAGGIINMVEMLISNISVEKAKLEGEEATSKREFTELETKLKVNLATSRTNLDHTKAKKSELEQLKGNLGAEQTTAEEMLEAQMRIWEGLQKKCVHAASFEERVKQREAEIASLQEALKILQGEL